MAGGIWLRILAAAIVALGGLLIARSPGVALTTDQLGALIFAAAVFWAFRQIGRHFDQRERDGGE
jgi:hypothetical protein